MSPNLLEKVNYRQCSTFTNAFMFLLKTNLESAHVLIAKSSPNGSPSATPKSRKSGFFGSKKEKKGSKGKLDKTLIGLPSNFRHLGHIGWDPNKGFNVRLQYVSVYTSYHLRMHLLTRSLLFSNRSRTLIRNGRISLSSWTRWASVRRISRTTPNLCRSLCSRVEDPVLPSRHLLHPPVVVWLLHLEDTSKVHLVGLSRLPQSCPS